ncbi:MAG TPA: hypothetical protein VG013_15905, partial [Gemmataceae bacterium]|nr:hypothetical protein [Gemmataceae bacterium]
LGGRPNQYDLWPGFAQSAHLGDGLVLVLDASDGAQAVVEKIKPYFHHVGQAKLVTLRGRAERRLWVCEGWTGYWPDSARVPLAP